MAITTLDGLLAGMQYPREFVKAVTPTMTVGRPQSLFYLAGIPPAAAAPSPGIGGEVLTTYAGQLPFTNPGAGNTYLSRFVGQGNAPGTLLLCDRLWQNSGINITSVAEQSFVGSAQIPARDENGTNAGVGVYAAVEVSTITGVNAPTLTLKYTNQAGTPGQTATNLVTTSSTSAVGCFFPIGLAAGDTGVQKAESLTLSVTWTSGVIHVVLYRILARLELPTALFPNAIDALTSGFTRIYNDSVPFLVYWPSAATASNVSGHVIWSQG